MTRVFFMKNWSFSPSALRMWESPISSSAIDDNKRFIVSQWSKDIVGVMFGMCGSDISSTSLWNLSRHKSFGFQYVKTNSWYIPLTIKNKYYLTDLLWSTYLNRYARCLLSTHQNLIPINSYRAKQRLQMHAGSWLVYSKGDSVCLSIQIECPVATKKNVKQDLSFFLSIKVI